MMSVRIGGYLAGGVSSVQSLAKVIVFSGRTFIPLKIPSVFFFFANISSGCIVLGALKARADCPTRFTREIRYTPSN